MDWRLNLAKIMALKKSKRHSSNRFFFIHIPKTAGTTFRYLLYQQFQQERIFSNQSMILNNNGRYQQFDTFKNLSIEEQKAYELICGHYFFSFGQTLALEYQYMTFLRHPVERVMSHIYHMKRKHENLKEKPPEEVFELKIKLLSNFQIKYFMADHKGPIEHDSIQKAKENLESFAFVGLTDRFKESLSIAENNFNWKMTSMGKMNQAKDKPMILSSEFVKRIEETSAADLEFYEFGVQLFEKRLRDS